MKKFLLIAFGVFQLTCLQSINLYWVGGSGNWSDSQHWSLKSGGEGGATIPTVNDNVFFDANSFFEDNQTVTVNENITCNSIDWSKIDENVIFSSTSEKSLTVNGSYTLSPLLWNGFKGQTIFQASSKNNHIATKGRIIQGDIVFNGTGSWVLKDDITFLAQAGIYLNEGYFNSNNKKIVCGSFATTGSESRGVDLGKSLVKVNNNWDFENSNNLSLNISNAEITVNQTNLSDFKGAKKVASSNLKSLNSPQAFTVTITQISFNSCFGDNKAVIVATVSGGTAPYDFSWSTGQVVTNTNSITDTLKNQAGSINVIVQDANGNSDDDQVNVAAPSAINIGFSNVRPSCSGSCDGSITPIVTGGTPAYNYLWSTGATTNKLSNACANVTYTLTITDANGCVGTKSGSLTQPNPLLANGTSTNVSCFGGTTGSASTAPSGGTSPYTHHWNTGSTAASLTNLGIGTYTDTVKDSKGCTVLYTTIITQPALALSVSASSQTNVKCRGNCTGAVIVGSSGGTSPYTYSWSNGSTGSSISNLCAGSYTVTATDANGCTATQTITITQPAAILSAVATQTNVSCFGLCNGIAEVTASGGTGAYAYVWAPGNPIGNGTDSISALCASATAYTVTVTDANLCTATANVTITEPALLIPNPTSTDITCNAANDGTAKATPTGGTPPYTYLWSPGTPTGYLTDQITGLSPATYNVLVTDSKGCDTLQSVTVNQPTLISPNLSKTDIGCNGGNNGIAKATPSGGTGPYTYVWGPGTPTGYLTDQITGLAPGTYSVTVKDSKNCSVTASITVVQTASLNLNISSTPISCNGGSNGTASVVVSGGSPAYTYDWLPGTPAGDLTDSITNLSAGTYTVNVIDALGCTATNTVTITNPPALTLSTSKTDLTCYNVCIGSASAVGGGGTPPYNPYSWAPGGQTTASITSQCAGTYTVTFSDSQGCSLLDTVTITQPAQLLANPSILNNITCFGDNDGAATALATGGTGAIGYVWTPGSATTQSITNLSAGTYSVTATDANLCQSVMSVTILEPSALSASILSSTSSCSICNGTAIAIPSGGTAPYNYSWNTSPVQTTQTATGLCSNTTYTVTVTDANNCVTTTTVTILPTTNVTISISNNTLNCFGDCNGNAVATGSGGAAPYTYSWSGSSGVISGSQSASGLCAGTYTVTVTDVTGCANTQNVTFSNPSLLVANSSQTNVDCNSACNGIATANFSGGTGSYTYSWNTFPIQTTQTATNLCAGIYTLTVTDSLGCIKADTITITEPLAVIDNPTITNTACLASDGIIEIVPSGGTPPYVSFDWGPGSPTGDGTTQITNLAAGAYTLTITDNAGCHFNFNYLVNNLTGAVISASSNNVSCHDACDGDATVALLSGSITDYLWTPGNATTQNIASLCGTTTYTIQVTDPSGCITLDTTTVHNPELISPNPTITPETCVGANNAIITLTPTGGTPYTIGSPYTYLWAPGGATTSSISGLSAGTYTVTVTDSLGCDSVLTITINPSSTFTATLTGADVSCKGLSNGSTTVIVSGGTGPYSYSWSPLGPAYNGFSTVNGLAPNQYIVTVTDANSCIAKDTIVITEPLLSLTTSNSQTNISCNGLSDGIAVVNAIGGTAPYTYLWSPIAVNNDTASGLGTGSYVATVTDNNGCTSSTPIITITEPAAISASVNYTNPKCNTSCDGSASVVIGAGSYSYAWAPGGQTGSPVSTLCAGTHTVTITEAGSGCIITQTITLTAPPVLDANPSSTSPICYSGCDGSATANPFGGTSPYTYLWSHNGATTATVSNLCTGTYNVTVTDTNSCVSTKSITVTNPVGIDISVGTTLPNCGVSNGSISVAAISGVAPYSYLWNNGDTTQILTGLLAGIYTVKVTDSKGCDSTFTIPLNNTGGMTGETISTDSAICNGNCNGSGKVIPVGGLAPYSFLWNNPAATADSVATNLCAGNYLVQVTDANSCIRFSTVTIEEPTPILVTDTITNALCSGICTGTIAVSPATGGNTGAYTYSWGPGNPVGQGTTKITGLCPITYTLTITDSKSCTQVDSFTVNQTIPLTATIGASTISCSSACTGMAYVNITAGTPPYTIQWDDPSSQTNDTAIGLCAGIYNATITDGLGCSLTLSVNVTATPAITANDSVTNTTCGLCDGIITLLPTGGTGAYTYLWSNGQTTANATNLCAGVYNVDITDAVGCKVTATIPVSNTGGPSDATITSTDVTCNGGCNGSVTGITPIGGIAPYTFSWISNGQTTSTLSNLCAGIYYVQIADSTGCILTDSVTINEPAKFLANQILKAPTTCSASDGSIIIAPSGGVQPYNILWNTGSTNDTLLNLSAGIYSVQLTDAVSCVATVVIPLNNLNAPVLSMSSTDSKCYNSCNGTATVVPSGGTPPYVSYLWNDNGSQTTATANSLCAGTYYVAVKDANNCLAISSATISAPDSVRFSVGNTVDPLCKGDTNGVITVVPFGGTLPYTYSWSPIVATTSSVDSLLAGSYTVTVTDGNNCASSQIISLIDPLILSISNTTTNSSCSSIPDGVINVTVAGGTVPYTYQWRGGSSAKTEDLLATYSGTYTITATDKNGCKIKDTVVLGTNSLAIANAGNDSTFCESGTFTLDASNSINAATYQWFVLPSNNSIGNKATQVVSPEIGTTSYYVSIDNGSGCIDRDTITLMSNVLPNVNAGLGATIVIKGSTVIGGNPTSLTSSKIKWTPSTALDYDTIQNPTASPLTTTVYTVTVTSANGCTASDSMTVTVLPTVVIQGGFSPNGDGVNDRLIIGGVELFPNTVVEIYNRWGELLFQSTPGYKTPWDGTYNGKPLPVGSYYYVVNLNDPDITDVYTGPVTILR